MWSPTDSDFMLRALVLAQRGQGYVEPNPMVGCVIARDGQVVGEGWHQRFGWAHAEIEALRAAGERAAGATLYVTLEPCCHHGKTPPCTDAIIAAKVQRVIAAMRDPFSQVAGGGFGQLAAAGIAVEVGLHEAEASELNAPYLKLLATDRPWVIAKWAMTLDGKLATRTGDSRWISSAASRAIVHGLRGRVDAIVVGRGTVERDDPLLTARLEHAQPARIATRVVLDSRAQLRSDSQLVRTARAFPTLVAAGPEALDADICRLTAAGCEVLVLPAANRGARLDAVLADLGRRRMTNLLVEGGSEVLGSFFDAGQIDEVHAFIAARLAGGAAAPSPIGGRGVAAIAEALHLLQPQFQASGGDQYVSGRLQRAAEQPADRQ